MAKQWNKWQEVRRDNKGKGWRRCLIVRRVGRRNYEADCVLEELTYGFVKVFGGKFMPGSGFDEPGIIAGVVFSKTNDAWYFRVYFKMTVKNIKIVEGWAKAKRS